ncbi:Uncharacterised protein [Mycobacteroides abscessus subsp. abscessus]|nr:Uncharacterised protein [Mycobacteroides abscessus subsp. abscessus]
MSGGRYKRPSRYFLLGQVRHDRYWRAGGPSVVLIACCGRARAYRAGNPSALATIPHCSSKGELAIHVNDDAAPHSALKKIC